jgi:hypothetical protein
MEIIFGKRKKPVEKKKKLVENANAGGNQPKPTPRLFML